jgi:predicted nucleic acid-binding protein
LASKPGIIVDTGPLVAFVHGNDMHHRWVTMQFKQLPAPFVTCEPVLAETAFLLSRHVEGSRRFFDLLASGLLDVNFSLFREQQALARLCNKYKDLPMSLADACLVRMAEQFADATVLTLDTHFLVYRKNGRQAIPCIMPPAAQ